MGENRAIESYVCRLTTKMGLVDNISREIQLEAVNTSTYVEQFIVAKMDSIKQSTKKFRLKSKKYTNFAEQKAALNSCANN